ncbi:MAG: PQQ-binding-like beta-propeller repeat protein, partial [Planctomycetes bacterium]|nr:PQQ-binding-like beta-propeller repeat protein [Planctomycetota bacterium]
ERTVQVQGEGATIRVEAAGDGATVQVQTDDGATVQVQSDSEATVQVKSEGGATVRVDDEDAHAGLDLPTAMIQGFTETGRQQEEKEAAQAAAPQRDLKKIIAVVAVLILIPVILLGLARFNAQGTFSELETSYAALIKSKDKRPDKLRALATEMEAFALGDPFAGGMADRAQELKKSLESEAARIERDEKGRREEAARKKKADEDALRIAGERKKVLGEYRKAEREVIRIEDDSRQAQSEGSSEASDLWQAYVDAAKRLMKDYAQRRLDHKDIDERLSKIRFPVFVTSDPSGAEVIVKGVTRGQTPVVLRERPGTIVSVILRRKGFTDSVRAGTVKDVLYLDAALDRRTLREPLELGTHAVRFGAGKIAEPILPMTPFTPTSNDQLLFVGHGGNLRSYSPQNARQVWATQPQHAVARYGDPVPALMLIEGRAVLVASPLGQLRAHSPGNGSLIWRVDLDAPATSPPIFKRVFGLVAVGTASGSVYLINDGGEIKSTFQTENPVVSPPYFYGDRICVVGSTDNRLYAIEWRDAKGEPRRVPKELSRLDLGSDVVAGPQPLGPKLVVGTASGQVHVIKISQRGKLTLETSLGPAGPDPVAGIVVEGDSLYFSAGNRLTSYNAKGKARWSEPFVVSATLTAPYTTLEGGMIYVGDKAGTLHAIAKVDGESRWRFPIPGEDSSIERPPVKVGEELLVFSGGKIYVLAAD